MKKIFLLFLLCLSSFTLSPSQRLTLYKTLDPSSISQHLAFYELYSQTLEGKEALQHAWHLLNRSISSQAVAPLPALPSQSTIQKMIDLLHKTSSHPFPTLSEEELQLLEKLGEHLPHRHLKGHFAKNEQQVLVLPTEEIDLARGLLLSQLGNGAASDQAALRTYEALLDLMALQILSRLPEKVSDEQKIEAMNTFIFEEMDFRFPPHSAYAKDIDLYTFLPSVLDSHRGVCLGVSILYLCLAQRLDLSLNIVTPPGHIFVQWKGQGKERNIETTARGIHLDSEVYLGINTKSLQTRSMKEVIGLAHFNQAAVYWVSQQPEKALEAYKKAEPYLPEDPLLAEFMAYAYLLVDEEQKGKALLRKISKKIPSYAVWRDSLVEEILQGDVGKEGVRALFLHVDENRETLLQKKQALEEALQRYPRFHNGKFHLATVFLQMHRQSEALEILERYHQAVPEDPTGEYYLSVLYAQRLHYQKAWEHLHRSESILTKQNHHPKALKELRKELTLRFPENI